VLGFHPEAPHKAQASAQKAVPAAVAPAPAPAIGSPGYQ
jgi:hypothetical protein